MAWGDYNPFTKIVKYAMGVDEKPDKPIIRDNMTDVERRVALAQAGVDLKEQMKHDNAVASKLETAGRVADDVSTVAKVNINAVAGTKLEIDQASLDRVGAIADKVTETAQNIGAAAKKTAIDVGTSIKDAAIAVEKASRDVGEYVGSGNAALDVKTTAQLIVSSSTSMDVGKIDKESAARLDKAMGAVENGLDTVQTIGKIAVNTVASVQGKEDVFEIGNASLRRGEAVLATTEKVLEKAQDINDQALIVTASVVSGGTGTAAAVAALEGRDALQGKENAYSAVANIATGQGEFKDVAQLAEVAGTIAMGAGAGKVSGVAGTVEKAFEGEFVAAAKTGVKIFANTADDVAKAAGKGLVAEGAEEIAQVAVKKTAEEITKKTIVTAAKGEIKGLVKEAQKEVKETFTEHLAAAGRPIPVPENPVGNVVGGFENIAQQSIPTSTVANPSAAVNPETVVINTNAQNPSNPFGNISGLENIAQQFGKNVQHVAMSNSEMLVAKGEGVKAGQGMSQNALSTGERTV